jgi:dUTP pyrophosphatase
MVLPKKAYPNDAGLDLTVSRYQMISPSTRVQLPHNLAMAIPEGCFGLILPRSSTFLQKGLLVHPGIVDSGYRGEVHTVVYNPGPKAIHVGEGARISQLLILPIIEMGFVNRNKKNLPPGDRGDKGFGSTGGFEE